MFKLARGWGLIGALDPTAGLSRPAKEAPGDRVLFDGAVLVGPDPRVNEVGPLVEALLEFLCAAGEPFNAPGAPPDPPHGLPGA